MNKCPKCGSTNFDFHQESVDIGVGIQYGPIYWACHACGADQDNYCSTHHRDFESIKDRQEHFEHEKADPFGCPSCYGISIMELQ